MLSNKYNFSKSSSPYIQKEYQLHCHNHYELYYFISGDVKYMVEGKMYSPKPKSILLLKPGLVHGVQNTSEEVYTRYAFHFSEDLLSIEHRDMLLWPFAGESIYFENIDLISSFEKVLSALNIETENLREFSVKCRFESLLTELFPLGNIKGSDPKDNLAYKITVFIDQNIEKDLSLDFIANKFFISKSQLSRIFKRDLESTVGNYIGLKRSVRAKQLIMQGQSASTAATACGFKDYSTFFRTYKKFMGKSPAQIP